MPSKDFTANQIRVTKLIASGGLSGGGAQAGNNIGIAVYSASNASDVAGGITDASMLDQVGKDVFMFISGSTSPKGKDHIEGSITLVGGDLHISGNITTNGSMPAGSITGTQQRIPFFDAASGLLTNSDKLKFNNTSGQDKLIVGNAGSFNLGWANKVVILEEINNSIDHTDPQESTSYGLIVTGEESTGLSTVTGSTGIGLSRSPGVVGSAIIHSASDGTYSKGHLSFHTKTADGSGGALTKGVEIRGDRNGQVRIHGGNAGSMQDPSDGNRRYKGKLLIGNIDGETIALSNMGIDNNTIQVKGTKQPTGQNIAVVNSGVGPLFLNPCGGHVGIGTADIDNNAGGGNDPQCQLHIRTGSSGASSNVYAVKVFHDGNDAQCAGISLQVGQNSPSADYACTWLRFFDGDGDLEGSIAFDASSSAAGLNPPSDERIKTEIRSSDVNALSLLSGIELKSFRRAYRNGNLGPHVPIGFTAQDVENNIPNLVGSTSAEGYDFDVKSVSFSGFIPYLVKAVQQLKQENDNLKARIEALEG
jgi:hypothetical protein